MHRLRVPVSGWPGGLIDLGPIDPPPAETARPKPAQSTRPRRVWRPEQGRTAAPAGLLAVSLNSLDDRDWVLEQTGATELTEIGRLTGGITSLMLALEVDGRDLVLRRIDKQPWLRLARPSC